MIEEVIRKKLTEMSVEEKVAQTQAVWIHHFMENGEISWDAINRYLRYGVGEVRVAGTHLRLAPEKIIMLINQIQSYLINNTRHHIPALIREECLAGLMAPTATPFPQAINMASTWDENLIYTLAKTIASQSAKIGVNHCLSPVLDLCLDPRWGRCEETFGEDPYLSGVIGLHYIKGIQEPTDGRRIISTAKHFLGYGYTEGGRNKAPFVGNYKDLLEHHLFPFEVAVKMGNVGAVMVAYNEIDGIPCHANKWLLTEILRNKLGFNGLITSDGDGVLFLISEHEYARSCVGAYKLAIESGIDVVSNILYPIIPCFEEIVKEVKNGYISQDALDRAVEKVLMIKYLTGVINNPFIEGSSQSNILDSEEYRQVAYEVAVKSIVLLKNNGILPLNFESIKTISVIGPGSDDPSIMLGDYHFDAHRGFHSKLSVEIKSLYDAIKDKLSSRIQVLHARGCDYTSCSDEGIEKALELGSKSDLIILVVGERSGLNPAWIGRGLDETMVLSGEGVDRSTLKLTEPQEKLVREIGSLGKPLIVILLNGRPIDMSSWIGYVDAIIEAWKPGIEGASAIVDILTGRVNPSGRLPISYPKGVGNIPVYYYRKPSSMGYYLEGDGVLYPFGFGLSYSEFNYLKIEVEPKKIEPDNKVVRVKVLVSNEGPYPGDEIVQLYIKRKFASVTRPSKLLRGFTRVHLDVGESKYLIFELPVELLSHYDKDMKQVVERGEYEVMIGRNSADTPLKETILVVEDLPVSYNGPLYTRHFIL